MNPQHRAPRLVLASASAARKSLLSAAGLCFEAIPAAIDEDEVKRSARAGATLPEDTALLLAELKARRIVARHPDAVVIGADQLLVCEGEWFDKPANLAAARVQLRRLRGRRHTLITAVLCAAGGAMLWHHVSRPSLVMRRFSDDALEAYLAMELQATASVGAYRLEGAGVQLFEAIEGDFFSILGLPLLPLLGFLRQHGVLPN